MARQSSSLFGVSDLPFQLVFLMWLTFTVQFYTGWDLYFLGTKARNLFGLIGIFTGPLIHGNFVHIVSNTIPLLFLSTTLFFFYQAIGKQIFLAAYFIPNILVWMFSPRQSYHIGSSGMVYALAAFLIVYGILKRDFISLLVSAAVIGIYGSIFLTGLLPKDVTVSWEAHLSGAITGLSTAVYFHFFRRR